MPQTVFAKDVYIASYEGGGDVYIVTETIDTNQSNTVRVTLKFIENGNLNKIEHRIYGRAQDGMWWLSSEEGKRNGLRPTRVWEPAKDKILQYCLSYRR